jgi:TrmH family RNA methyltransferase
VPEYSRVTSVKSDRVTAVRGLQTRQGRRKAGLFLVVGPQAISSALAAGIPIHDLFVVEDAGGSLSPIVSDAEAAGSRITLVTSAVMGAMAQTEAPAGLLAVCPLLADGDIDRVLGGGGPLVVLEQVSDPGNVGTVIRTADAAGAAGVVLTPGSADVHNGKVVRSTAGSLFHLPVLSGCALADVVAAAHRHRRTVAVLTGDGELDLFAAARSATIGARTVWIVGSEAHGVSDEARLLADHRLRIPMAGRAESLNAAVAAAAALYVSAYAAASDSQHSHGAHGAQTAE